MKSYTLRPLWLSLVFAFILTGGTAYSQNVQSTQGIYLGKTQPLRDLVDQTTLDTDHARRTKAKNFKRSVRDNFEGNIAMPNNAEATAQPQNGDPLAPLSKTLTAANLVEPEIVIDGINEGEAAGVIPPDVNGDVSPDYYFATTNGGNNSVIKVYDKELNLLFGPVNSGIIWDQINESTIGDPIILWDEAANRWMFAEINIDFQSMLIAVSETEDPTGAWFAYKFNTPDLPDYPKFGIWNDAIYFTTNEFDDHVPVYILDKNAMLNGENDITLIRLDGILKFNVFNAFQVLTPADIDGPSPPAGSPMYVIRIYDDAWDGGEDGLEVWSISPDFDTPTNTVLDGPNFIPLAAFDSDVCNGDIFNCVAQGDGTLVSALQQVIMWRVPYRNFGSHETILLNFTVDASGSNQAGIRWVELRKENGEDWSLYQEGTYAPDNLNRFMGSIAMDANGNILLGYAVTGENTPLSIRYTGQLGSPGLGVFNIDEYDISPEAAGISFGSRWGDYFAMSVDPTSGSRFYLNGEYITNSGWNTKIMSVQLRRDSNDIGVSQLVTPQTSGFLTDAEQVTVNITNFGFLAQDEFDVTLELDGNFITTETINQNLNPQESLEHTFTATVDLEEIGDYDFKIYTTLATDTLPFNDTLRATVTQLTRNDAQIVDFEGLSSAPICEFPFSINIVLRNAGQENLTSVTIKYSINGGTENEINWTGNLAPGETEDVPIQIDLPLDADNTLTAFTEMPNGVMDEDPTNDALSREFTTVTDGEPLTFTLLTDLWPSETTWQLENDQGDILFSGGPYTLEQTVFTEEWCLPLGCYTFTIFDSFGDGMQYLGVEGSYSITDPEGNVLASIINANFGTEEVNPFCYEIIECDLELEATVTDDTSATANDGQILLEAINGTAPYEYSIDGGDSFSTLNFFINLEPGEYQVLIRDVNNCEAEAVVVVDFVNSLNPLPTQVDVSIAPNPTKGHFQVKIDGMDQYNELPIEIIDVQGRIVQRATLGNYSGTLVGTVSIKPFAAGTYYVHIVTPEYRQLLPIIKE